MNLILRNTRELQQYWPLLKCNNNNIPTKLKHSECILKLNEHGMFLIIFVTKTNTLPLV